MKQALPILFTTIAIIMAEGANAIASSPSSVNTGWGNQFERIAVEEGVSCGGGADDYGDDVDVCPEGEFCHRETGSCDGAGVCKLRPEVCTMDYTPVCGCDDKIYGNLCGAYAKGMSVSYLGECGSNKQGWFGSFSLNLSPVQATRDESSGRNDGFPGALLCVIFLSSLAFTWNF